MADTIRLSELRQPIAPLMKNITVNVRITGLKALRARLWLAAKLFAFAGHVAGCNVEIEMDRGGGSRKV